ncbi:uncharacterized protein LOC126883185 isoform X1 [Diabrotica virgifera virgifera]|uniref:G-patch domain-containing protein n=1 Tax=Diabrotica virgifera virgifera TaxID=50390 RepID=A0ABM5K2G5_DIAVI|nr:uncharacterized protein LOC126883185 isoform X1 [Diabrotica virgifera virgifera]
MEPVKKISFGFSKTNKKPLIFNKSLDKKVDYIVSLEGQSVKLKDESKEVEKAPLVIPLKDNQTDLLQRVRDMKAKQQNTRKNSNDPVEEDNRPDSDLTIEELAAREIVKEAKQKLVQNDTSGSKNFVIFTKKADELPLEGKMESTLVDYENIPVNDFGLAMLRGMGWKEGMSIGKNTVNMEQKRKKLSGSQYKKIRMQKEEQGRKLSNVMKEFLVQKSCLDEPSTSPTATATNLSNKNLVPFSGDKEKQEIMSSVVPQQPGSSSSGCHQIVQEIPSDPALWNIFSMYSETRQILVERGPYQIKEFDFPINKGKRRFSSLHYSKMLSNGEVVERSWLIYSVTNDAVFCFCCFLFDNLSTISDWPKKGYSDWGNLTRAVTMHEKSVNHRNAFRAWQELDIRLKQKKTIDAEYQRIMDKEILHWREVLKRILSIIRLLASQCLAFRGTTNHLFQPNNGNFLKLVELLSEFDPVMEEHIMRVQRESDKWSVTYLSNSTQDELISLMGNVVLNKIVEIAKIALNIFLSSPIVPQT